MKFSTEVNIAEPFPKIPINLLPIALTKLFVVVVVEESNNALVSSTLGGLYGAFETYKDYQSMKKRISEYVAPDLSEFDKRLSMVEETSTKTNDYTRDIKNDIKTDIRKLESIVEQVERSSKQSQRETDQDVRALRKEVDNKIQKALDNPLAGK